MSEEIKVSEEAIACSQLIMTKLRWWLEHYKTPVRSDELTKDEYVNTIGKGIQLLLNQRDTKIAALEAEVGELRKDKERLDWLSDSIPTFSIGAREKAGVVIFTDPCDFGGRNLREALDAALNSTKGEK